jgi:hypothetical protein
MLVFFDCGTSIRLEKCIVEVKQADFDKNHKVGIEGVPVFEDRDDENVQCKVKTLVIGDGEEKNFDDSLQVYEGTHIYTECGTCTSFGDPHFTVPVILMLDFQRG